MANTPQASGKYCGSCANTKGRAWSKGAFWWPSAHACRNTVQGQRLKFHGVSESQERAGGLRQACEPEIQVWKQAFLGARLQCGCCGLERCNCGEIYPIAREARHCARQTGYQRARGHLQGAASNTNAPLGAKTCQRQSAGV